MQDAYKQYKSDNLLGFQEKSAVFVKIPITAYGKTWKAGEEFNWITQPCRAEDWDKMRLTVASLYNQGKLHHDSAREVQNKIGDRLGELNTEKLISLVRQVNAIVNSVQKLVSKTLQEKPWHVEGSNNAEWVLLDYVHVVVHVFQKQIREFYNIEGLWGDARSLKIETSIKKEEA